MSYSELKKLSEESLTRQPEEVFDIICKLGEGSYGSVYKALHKESDQVINKDNFAATISQSIDSFLDSGHQTSSS